MGRLCCCPEFIFKAWEVAMKEDKRTKLLTVRVSPSEMAAMKEAAEKEGLSLSKLVRRETLKPKPGDGQRVTKP